MSQDNNSIIAANKIAEEYNIQDMSLDEINKEIEDARKSKK